MGQVLAADGDLRKGLLPRPEEKGAAIRRRPQPVTNPTSPAAVILGGTALSGGRGSVIGTFFGALLMATINYGLILGGLDTSQQQIIRGIIIVLAVALARQK